jgi:hypothetical protein
MDRALPDVVAHGDVVAGGGAAALRATFDWLLSAHR